MITRYLWWQLKFLQNLTSADFKTDFRTDISFKMGMGLLLIKKNQFHIYRSKLAKTAYKNFFAKFKAKGCMHGRIYTSKQRLAILKSVKATFLQNYETKMLFYCSEQHAKIEINLMMQKFVTLIITIIMIK